MIYWVDGIRNNKLFFCRSIQFGNGFFTTIKLVDKKIKLLDLHVERLKISAKRLLFDNFDLSLLIKEIQMVASSDFYDVMKVIVIRKNNEKDSKFHCCRKENLFPLRIIICSYLPKYYSSWLKNGVHLISSPIRLVRDLFFSGIKHLNRLEYDTISQYFNNKNYNILLLLDTEDNVIECNNANIFWRYGKKVFTPSLTHAGIFGVMRCLILNTLPKLGYQIQEVMTNIEALYEADEVFISNTLFPIMSVNSIDKYFYSNKTLFDLLLPYCV